MPRASRAAKTLSPSDLPLRRRGLVSVGGRVFLASADELVLRDAFSSVSVRGRKLSSPPAPGELVVVRGLWTGSAIERARLDSRVAAPTPRGDGEFGRLVFDGVGPFLHARARALRAVREHFHTQGFVEVETPLAVPCPGVDRNVDAVRASSGWLITSPELEMKRLLVGGVPRLFQLSRVSRADEAGRLHEPEFTLLEWYRAFSDPEPMLEDTENVVHSVACAVSGAPTLTLPGGRQIRAEPPFERLGIREAFKKFAGVRDASDLAATDEDRYFQLLVDKVEPALAAFERPVFLGEYPISEAALARPTAADPRYAERYELYAGGVELSNGYGELTDAVEQRRRFSAEHDRRKREGRVAYPLNERFLAALEEGMPPSAGNALGFDRLVMLATGAAAVQDVMAFPRARL